MTTNEQVLLDTGILLRAVNRSDPEHITVRDALRLLRGRQAKLVTCYQNLAEFWNVFTRPITPNHRTGYGGTIEDAQRCVRFFRKYADFVSESNASGELTLVLMEQQRVTGSKVHDARLAAIALSQAIPKILTMNPADFRRYPNIDVVTPAEILASPA